VKKYAKKLPSISEACNQASQMTFFTKQLGLFEVTGLKNNLMNLGGAPKLGRIMDAIVTLGVDIVNELQKQVEEAAEQAHGAYGGSVLPAAGK